MIWVLLAEDQAMVRGALAALLNREQDISIVADVARGDEVMAAALKTLPDVVLLDIEMPGATGIEAAGELHAQLPECKVLILTTFGRPGYLRRALQQGVAGFLVKDAQQHNWLRPFAGRWLVNVWWIRSWPPQPLVKETIHSPSASRAC